MKALMIIHPRKDRRLADVALAEAVGAEIYHDPAGTTYAVHQDGKQFYTPRTIEIGPIPETWARGAADPIGGWEPKNEDNIQTVEMRQP